MTPRLFLGNFDFEHRLAEPSRQVPDKLKRLNAELACAWLSIAEDGDWIWTPLPIDTEFFQEAQRQGLPKVFPVTSLSDVPREVECIPWGWSADVRRMATQFGWIANAPSDEVVRLANSRATSDELERSWSVGLQGAQRIEALDDFQKAVRAIEVSHLRWVVKAEFGMSARERILGQGLPKPSDENWVRRRLALSKVVFFEPWVDRIDEVGIQIDVPQNGPPRLIGLTPIIVDGRGQYAGSWFACDDSRFQADRMLWSEGVEIALRAAEDLQLRGYFGPLGIDAMVYLDVDGSRRIRPLQDINARWTMGRLSLGWKRLIVSGENGCSKSGEQGCWRHGSMENFPLPMDMNVTRILRTSPKFVGGLCCQHLSHVMILHR